MTRWQKWGTGVGAFLVLGAGFIAFVLPGIVRNKAVEGIEAATGRKAAIARVAINPLTWTVRAEGVRLSEKGSDATFVSFSSVKASVSPRSLFRLAPIVSEAHLSAPYVHIVRTAANTYNFSDLLERKKKEPEKPLNFSLNNITIANGSVDFVDRALPEEKRHRIRQIEVGIPFISNIPYLADRYVLPHFSALVNGSPLKLDGKLKPFVKGAETAFDLNLKELSLPYYFSYYPGTPPVQMDSGRLTTTLEIVHRVTADNKPELEVKGDIVLADLKMRDRGGAPLVSLARGAARISRAEVMARNFALTALIVDGLEMYLSRDRQGAWNYQRLAEGGKPAGGEEKPAAEPAPKPVVDIGDIQLTGSRFHFDDRMPPGGFSTDLTGITLAVKGFSTAPGKKGTYTLAFATARGEKGSVKGGLAVEPLAATASVELKELLIDAYYPYLADALTAPVKGRLDVAAELSYTAAEGLRIANGNLAARQLAVAFGKEDGVKLAQLAVSGVSGDLKGRTAEVEGVKFSDGTIRVSRAPDGRLSPLGLLREAKKGKAAPAKGGKGEPPFRYRVKGVDGSGLNVFFTDRTKEDAPQFRLRKLAFSLAEIAGPRFAPMPFKISAGYGGRGTIRASGSVTPAPFRLKGECALRRIPLADFDPYLPDNVDLTVVDGSLDTKLSFVVAEKKGKVAGSFRGDLGVRSFHTLDAESEDLLKWESLELSNLRGTLAPFSLDVAGVSLSKFYSRIVVDKDGTLNLKKLVTPEKEKGEAPQPSATTAVASSSAAGAPPAAAEKGTIRIGTVTLQDGTIAFVDRHTEPEYASTMFNLGGRVSGLSSAANQLADVDLRGNLENHSPLRITGRINPLRDDLFVDLKVSFTDIEMSPFTPYSGTFLGYAVEKGKLYLDLTYHIENKKLDSENKLFLDQFTFGRKVESDRATSLPVRLAVALLKDRKGEIHLDLPVAGRTDDPQFSVWRVVLQMLKNLLAKAATAPFALLQSAFGGKEDFSSVHFAAGTARLSEAEQAKLRKLAQAIHDRPALKLEVTGFVDRERDPEGYRNEILLRKMKNEKYLALVKEKKMPQGAGAESMEITPAEQSTYLKAVYRKEKFPKPRNFIGLVKDIPDDEMRKLILAHTVVSDEELQNLARERAVTVRNFLVAEGKLPPERIFEKKGDVYKAPAREGESASRVEFGVAVQ